MRVNSGKAFIPDITSFASGGTVDTAAITAFTSLVPTAKTMFGGKILEVVYCPCSFNLAVTVGPPNGGVFTYEPGASIVDSFYQIFRPGPWVLGWYAPGGACLDFCVDCCYPMRTPIGTIIETGTSM